MRVRTFAAETMREALELVRNELGPEVVILGNRRTESGVELLTSDEPAEPDDVQAWLERAKVSERSPSSLNYLASDEMFSQMRAEIAGLRDLVERQVGALAWKQLMQLQPAYAASLRDLVRAGIPVPLARALIDRLPPKSTQEQANARIRQVLKQAIRVIPESDLAHQGCIALVGPTGVGKTTMAAKIAARHALKHGPDSVALVCMDTQRLGACEQLRCFGRVAGVPVFSATTGSELSEVLDHCGGHRLVIVDTAGVGTQHGDLNELAGLLDHVSITTFMVLAANAQGATLRAVAERFSALKPRGSLITKLDEAAMWGPVLGILAAQRWPLLFTSAGPGIPDDIDPPQVEAMIAEAMKQGASADPVAAEFTMEQVFAPEAHC